MAKYRLTENDIRKAIIDTIKEAHYRNVSDEIEPFMGRRPKSIKARINQIYKLVSKYGLSSRKYHDDHWQALNDYDKVISSMGCEFTYWCENGGYTDYDKHTNMPMSKLYNIRISYDDGMEIDGYIKMMAAGSMEDPFDAYDTCMVLWPKQRIKENKLDNMKKYRLTENKLRNIIKSVVKEALEDNPNGIIDPRFSTFLEPSTSSGDFWGETDMDKECDNEHSWQLFDKEYDDWKNSTPPNGTGNYSKYLKDSAAYNTHDIPAEIEKAFGIPKRNRPAFRDYDKADAERNGLGESKLRNIIRESVRGMINELDLINMPRFNDARDRDAWWKQQILNDFPEKRRFLDGQVGNYRELYNEFAAEKANNEKMLAKQQRMDARKEKQRLKQEKELAKQKSRSLFLNTVNYVICGEDSLMSQDQIMNDIDNEIPADWYDGVTKIPVSVNNTNVWAKLEGVGEGTGNNDGFISFGWGGYINELGEDGVFYMKFTVYVDANRKLIQFVINDVDNDNINIRKTEQLTTKYLNGVIRRKYKEAAAKIEKYGTSDITGW